MTDKGKMELFRTAFILACQYIHDNPGDLNYIFENNPEWLNAVVDSDNDFLGERWQQIFLKEATKILERRKMT